MAASSLSADLERLGGRLAAALGGPRVAGLHLPAAVGDETFRDEFGFVFLDDGSVGPFYVSMAGILEDLWRSHPEPGRLGLPAAALLAGFRGDDPAARALAVGSYNALSAALLRRTGFAPPARAGAEADALPAGATVGMVGYFCPVVERLTAQGHRVLVVEQAPQRVPPRARVSVTTDPHGLAACDGVLCSAATLINDTLEGLLAAAGSRPRFELIGPSGSGLPDPLFARGVSAVGGILFPERGQLLERLAQGLPWGKAGRKYQLDAAGYPGVEALLGALADRGSDPGQT
jgi:hypothetical protein